MALGTYQQSGPSAPQAARAVLAELPNQQKGFGDVPAALVTASGLRIQARAAGAGGEAITVTFTADAANTPLGVTVSGNAITVHLATDGANTPTSTARQVRDALNTDANASPLVAAALASGDGTAVQPAATSQPLFGDRSVTVGVDGSGAPLPKQHPASNRYA